MATQVELSGLLPRIDRTDYIRFAHNEAPLFRFLFQSGFSPYQSLQAEEESMKTLY